MPRWLTCSTLQPIGCRVSTFHRFPPLGKGNSFNLRPPAFAGGSVSLALKKSLKAWMWKLGTTTAALIWGATTWSGRTLRTPHPALRRPRSRLVDTAALGGLDVIRVGLWAPTPLFTLGSCPWAWAPREPPTYHPVLRRGMLWSGSAVHSLRWLTARSAGVRCSVLRPLSIISAAGGDGFFAVVVRSCRAGGGHPLPAGW